MDTGDMGTVGVVEMQDGSVVLVNPSKIQFTDTKKDSDSSQPSEPKQQPATKEE